MVLQAAALGLLLALWSACALAQDRPGPSSAPAKAPGSEAPALHVDFPRCDWFAAARASRLQRAPRG
jgi:hypothetical protein